MSDSKRESTKESMADQIEQLMQRYPGMIKKMSSAPGKGFVFAGMPNGVKSVLQSERVENEQEETKTE